MFEARTSTTKARGQETRARIVEAAIETLKREGFGGASARASAGPVGSTRLWSSTTSAACGISCWPRWTRRAPAGWPGTERSWTTRKPSRELIAAASEVYREDLASGHIKVLAEMIAGASSILELGPQIVRRIEPRIDFARDAVARISSTLPFPVPVPPEEAAFGIVALFLGIELLTHLEGDGTRSDRLFELGSQLGAMAGLLTGTSPAAGKGVQ